MSSRLLTLLAVVLILVTSPLAAQLRPAPLPPAHAARVSLPAAALDRGDGASLPLLAVGGVVGGTVGVFVGAVAGMYTACAPRPDEEGCFLRGLMPGVVAGESLLLPVGVHLVNGRRGSFGLSLLASAGLGAAGWGLLEATHYNEPAAPVIVTVVPLAQLAAAIAIERHTAPGPGR
ncbi:MAG TPA: hypothetical protein VHG28_04895 [Longimicrobiaceae bacterium]|nr:hypothetical protein [Longimicrobiaceae bacterium]